MALSDAPLADLADCGNLSVAILEHHNWKAVRFQHMIFHLTQSLKLLTELVPKAHEMPFVRLVSSMIFDSGWSWHVLELRTLMLQIWFLLAYYVKLVGYGLVAHVHAK